jgi:hypothetical protein
VFGTGTLPTTSPGSPGRPRQPSPGWLLAAIGIAAVLLAVVLGAPRLLYPPLTDRELDRQHVTNGKDRIELKREQDRLQNDARVALLQGLGGAVLLLGAYVAWRQVQTSRDQLQHDREQLQQNAATTRDQLELIRQGQLTERFTRAVDQLGNKSGQLDVVLGGIYALEQIARDSDSYRATVGEVLTAYVRSHAPWPPTQKGQPPADMPINELCALCDRAPDVSAAVTVLGRGGFAAAAGTIGLDLRRVDLRKVDASCADLQGADLTGAQLQGAYLARARLHEANLTGAQLQGANLTGARLHEAYLGGAQLYEARLAGAQLQGANLTGAHLNKAYLAGARLHEANLTGARLHGAGADRTTAWPDGFDPRAAGVHIPVDDPERPGHPN